MSVRILARNLLPNEAAELLGPVFLAEAVTEAKFARQVLLDPNYRTEGSIVALDSGGEPVGFCLAIARQVALENAPSDADRGYITLFAVRPSNRQQGTGSKLLEGAEDYLRGSGRTISMISPYAPGYFFPGVDVSQHAVGLDFLLRRGYEVTVRPLSMQTSLWALRVPEWVIEREKEHASAGIRYETFSPEITLPLLRFAQTEFSGDWVRVVRETGTRILHGDRADRLIAAVEGGGSETRVIGFSHWEGERFGPIGVAEGQRGKGIGQVLMYRTLRAQHSAGLRAAWFLWTDDRTAERIYNEAGFREIRRFAILRKKLS